MLNSSGQKKILKIKEINQLILDYYHLVYEEMVKIKDSLIELMQSIIIKTSECHITAEIWSISTEKTLQIAPMKNAKKLLNIAGIT